MDKVRIGIVGVGNMGSSHAKNIVEGKVDGGVLTAIADINPDRLAAMRDKLPEKVAEFNTASEMFDSGLVDLVMICVPHYFHPELSIEALNKGLHVICEKPAGVYTKQVKEMNAVAEKSDKVFAMMFNQRTNPNYIKMREMIAAGEIGEVKRITWIITDWYRTQFYYDSGSWRATWSGEGGGVLFNQCPHQIDLLQWVVGMMPKRVRAFCHFGKWHDIEVEDDVTAYFEYDNGATGTFITTTADSPGTNRFEIVGTRGTLTYDTHRHTLTVTKLSENEREWCKNCPNGFDQVPSTVEEFPEIEQNYSQHAAVVTQVCQYILGNRPDYIRGTEGIKGVTIADAMLLSTWLDKTIELPFDDDLYFDELKKRIATSRRKETVDKLIDTSGSYGSGGK
jgi:predicted dehydrogenase